MSCRIEKDRECGAPPQADRATPIRGRTAGGPPHEAAIPARHATAPRGRHLRLVWAALAALLTTAAPASSFATDTDEEKTPTEIRDEVRPVKPGETKKVKKRKLREHADPPHADDPGAGKSPEGRTHADKNKTHDGASKNKKAAARPSKKKPAKKKAAGKKAAKAASKAPKKLCFGPALAIDRQGFEGESFPLVDCDGAPLPQARQRLSLLVQPRAEVARSELPKSKSKSRRGQGGPPPAAHLAEIAPAVRLLDSGIVTRLAAIAREFPGKTVSLVGERRAPNRGSQHQTARAIDLRVNGVDNADLAAFCRTLPDTGCGYYPNSSFVHVDVRCPSAGTVFWIDASGPGEPPKYVTVWPPPNADAATVATAERLAGPTLHRASGRAPRP